jgi:hypothetical protein
VVVPASLASQVAVDAGGDAIVLEIGLA